MVATPDPIALAQALYARGRWPEAEPLCRAILDAQSDHPGALTLLGIMLARSRRAREAEGLLDRAAQRLPNDPGPLINHGNVLRDLGRHLDALSRYDRALELNPHCADAHFNRGLTLADLHRYQHAIESFERTLALEPDRAAAWTNRGAALYKLHRFEEALESFDRAIARAPDHADAYANRGACLRKLERFDESLASLDAALAIDARHPQAHFDRGVTLVALARHEDALASYEQAIALDPRRAEAHFDHGVVLGVLERFDEAEQSLERAIELSPGHAGAHRQLGNTLRRLRRFEEALVCLGRALALEPRAPETHFDLGLTLTGLKRVPEALESFERASSLGREDATLYRYRGAMLQELGRIEQAIESYAQALALDPRIPLLQGECCHARMGIGDWSGLETAVASISAALERGEAAASPFVSLTLLDSPALHRKAAETWTRASFSPRTPAAAPPTRAAGEKIRVGYFSADFHTHPVSLLAAGLFEAHDRRRFELTAFSLGADVRDAMRARLEAAFDRFLPVAEESDTRVARLARELQIDIAVDLGGYTGDARPGIFALRAAPIQVSYLGYLGTMGAGFIDYLIADPVLIPPASRRHYCEKIAYLPSYQVNDAKRPLPGKPLSRAQLGLPDSGFVFCCFNHSFKITPETFGSWMRILGAIPDSVLLLLAGQAATERNLRREAAARGIAPQRLVFGPSLPMEQYLARYRAADLFLDTVPYNAGTTASDALWSGLPVLTCPGKSFAARMAASVLTAAGLPELIAFDRPEYERLAIALATDPARLAALKQKLTHERFRCSLFDTATFTRTLETAFEQMHRRRLEGLAPEHIFPPDPARPIP